MNRFARMSAPLALVAMLLAGCATMDRQSPPAKSIDAGALGAKAAAVDWPRLDWWKRFADPQLDALVNEGLGGSPSLAAAEARVARANAAAGVSRAALYPNVTGTAESTYQRFPENYIWPPPFAGNWQTDNRLALDFSYEIDFWNKNRSALESALSQAEAAEADAQAARVILTTGIARAYFNLQ